MNKFYTLAAGASAIGLAFSLTGPAWAGEVNVYSYRQPVLVKPLFEAFTQKTGIKINVLFAKKGLIERIKAEGVRSPADLILTTDIGRLSGAVSAGITQSVNSSAMNANIPPAYRDKDGNWFGLTTRTRIILASRDRVKQDTITYKELADPKWRGKICIRSGQNVYNTGLIAAMIAHDGEQKTRKWLEGVKANLAGKPSGNDRAQVKGVFSGKCDLALVNSYYMGKMETNDKNPEQKQWAASVKMMFPNSQGRGVHVNISGVALAANAPNKADAIKLMEFLASDKGQQIYAEAVYEYPVKPGVTWSQRVKSWGTFKADSLPLSDIVKYRKRASELVDITGFNNGPSS
ncbi:Ferric iron ABC transporter, iron-binding protein [hydrothermal vent metagenome]|uniref:Ferric iron ABC transporter, iron-binding protein n=1 Tax=hydrothermal vent metagenome TaxID=652676 RepID=A0A3B0RWM1_9ZZZZ